MNESILIHGAIREAMRAKANVELLLSDFHEDAKHPLRARIYKIKRARTIRKLKLWEGKVW